MESNQRVVNKVRVYLMHDASTHMNTATQTAPQKATRFNLWLYPDLRQQLEQYSAETGCPMGEIFRRAAVAWIQRQQQTVRPA